jgi:hypothetical protein
MLATNVYLVVSVTTHMVAYVCTIAEQHILDDTYTLIHPCRKSVKPDQATTTRIVASLVTRLSEPTRAVHADTVRQHLPSTIEEWGKVQLTTDGDVVRAETSNGSQIRDASFVRVSYGVADVIVFKTLTYLLV